jgi:hypothetical protein
MSQNMLAKQSWEDVLSSYDPSWPNLGPCQERRKALKTLWESLTITWAGSGYCTVSMYVHDCKHVFFAWRARLFDIWLSLFTGMYWWNLMRSVVRWFPTLSKDWQVSSAPQHSQHSMFAKSNLARKNQNVDIVRDCNFHQFSSLRRAHLSLRRLPVYNVRLAQFAAVPGWSVRPCSIQRVWPFQAWIFLWSDLLGLAPVEEMRGWRSTNSNWIRKGPTNSERLYLHWSCGVLAVYHPMHVLAVSGMVWLVDLMDSICSILFLES